MEQQNKFEGWAVVEMFGHVKEIGFVTTQVFGTAVLFQIDTPELAACEITLEAPQWVEQEEGRSVLAGVGSKVKRPLSPGKTRLVGPAAIYSITPCTEEKALKAIQEFTRRPLVLLDLVTPAAPQVSWPEDDENGSEGDGQ